MYYEIELYYNKLFQRVVTLEYTGYWWKGDMHGTGKYKYKS